MGRGSDDASERRTNGHERARDQYGGFNIGAAFFGWLVAVGLAAILAALLSAAGAAIGLGPQTLTGQAATVGIVGAVLMLIVLALAYYCGGYVAGRMSRFDGARQGLGVWLFGIVVAILLAIVGALFGSQYNVLQQLNLPRIPVGEGSLAIGAVIALILWILVTLGAAIFGGKVGERYHGKVDRALG